MASKDSRQAKQSVYPVDLAVFLTALIMLAWSLFVQVCYLVTLNDFVISDWLRFSPRLLVSSYAILHLLVAPVLLLAAFARIRRLVPPGKKVGHYFGLVVACWLNTVFLSLPYIGGYPNLVPALIGALVSGGKNIGPEYVLPIMITNLVMWPILLGHLIPSRPFPEGCCDACGYELTANKSGTCPECGASSRQIGADSPNSP